MGYLRLSGTRGYSSSQLSSLFPLNSSPLSCFFILSLLFADSPPPPTLLTHSFFISPLRLPPAFALRLFCPPLVRFLREVSAFNCMLFSAHKETAKGSKRDKTFLKWRAPSCLLSCSVPLSCSASQFPRSCLKFSAVGLKHTFSFQIYTHADKQALGFGAASE